LRFIPVARVDHLEMEKEVKMAQETQKAIVQYKGEAVTITFNDVKNLLCPLATGQEVAVFLKTCQSLNLNPFANECYLVKYSEKDKAALIISIDSYLKAAEANPNYDGHEAGIILKEAGGKLDFREGAFILDDERDKLVGGWAKVYRKDRGHPTYMAVNKTECIRYTKDGHPTHFWTKEKQPSMLRKTALKRALVESFSQLFGGAISNAEFEQVPEDELPEAYKKGNESDWHKFWAKQAERGIDGARAHALLKVGSIKTELLDKGKSLEEVDEMITKALEEQQDELFPEPPLAENLATGWEIVKNTVKQLGLTEPQLQKWFGHYNIEVKLSDFDQELPPPQITNNLLSKFQSGLDAYQGKFFQGEEESQGI